MKTLTDYAHDVVARAAHGQDRDAMVHRCAIFDTRGVLEAYLSNPGASGALLDRLTDLNRADSFDDVCFATKRLREELDQSLDEAERMIAYRVDCLLNPEHGSRDEFERAQWFGERVKPHWPEWFEELDESEIPF